MPGLNADGSVRIPNARVGIPECQAGGNSNKAKCPEWHIHDANTNGFVASMRSCEGGDPEYSNCTRDHSCNTNMYNTEPRGAAYGPGDGFEINTDHEFHVKTEFHKADDGTLSSYTTTLSQDGRSITTENSCGDLSSMQEAISGNLSPMMMVGKAPWLARNECPSTSECSSPEAVYKNFSFNTAAGGGDGDNDVVDDFVFDTTFQDYYWVTPCNADACDDDCFDCRNSWPLGDTRKW